MFFVFLNRLGNSIYYQVGEVYLTNDLGYEKSDLSSIKVIVTPINIVLSSQVGYFAKQNAFRNIFRLFVVY